MGIGFTMGVETTMGMESPHDSETQNGVFTVEPHTHDRLDSY